MSNKIYKDSSSIIKPNTRYNQGGYTDTFVKRLGWWERDIEIARDEITDIIVNIDSKYHQRPDLVAYDYYGRTKLTWLVLMYNNIVDLETEFIAGKEIVIPSIDRVNYDILTKL